MLLAILPEEGVSGAQQIALLAGVILASVFQAFVHGNSVFSQSNSYLVQILVSQLCLLLGSLTFAANQIANPSFWLLLYLTSLWIGNLAATPKLITSTSKQIPSATALKYATARKTGLALYPGTIGWLFGVRAERLYLPIFTNLSDVGIYLVSLLALDLTVAATQLRVDASIPNWAKLLRSKGFLRRILVRELIWACGVSTISHVGLAALVLLVLDEPYAPVIDLLPVHVATSLTLALARVTHGILVSQNSFRRASIADAAFAVGLTLASLVSLMLGADLVEFAVTRLLTGLGLAAMLLSMVFLTFGTPRPSLGRTAQ
jgi:hypothetical protein